MILSKDMYVPVLRWRQGEYQALFRLSGAIKDRVVPLVSIPDVEFDFELRQPKKSVHEHVYPFVKRFEAKWGPRPAWISLNDSIAVGRMNTGSHVFDFVFDGIRQYGGCAIPALQLVNDADTIAAAHRVITQDGQGVGLLIRLEDLMTGAPRTKIVALASSLGVTLEEVDLIIDLRAPNFLPYSAFATALISALRRLGDIAIFRNLILVSTAIPESFKDIAKGTDEIPRHDWLFYQAFLSVLPSGMRQPNYGDYTIVHPEFTAMDMRMVKAAGKVVYTTPHTWATRKGGAFRDNPSQMHTHCDEIVKDVKFQFRGAAFSFGDDYIAKCAVHSEGSSNLTRWKDVAINHHITSVAEDLASLSAASSQI